MNRLMRWWRRRQRSTDVRILWPSCVKIAPTIDEAVAVFIAHAFNDPAWTTDMSPVEIIEYTRQLALEAAEQAAPQ